MRDLIVGLGLAWLTCPWGLVRGGIPSSFYMYVFLKSPTQQVSVDVSMGKAVQEEDPIQHQEQDTENIDV